MSVYYPHSKFHIYKNLYSTLFLRRQRHCKMIFYVKPKLQHFDRKSFLKDFHKFSYLIVCSYNFKLLHINLNSKFALEKAYFQFPLAWVHSIYVAVVTYIAFIVKSFLEFASSQLFWLGYFVLSLVTYNFLQCKINRKRKF